MATVTSEDQAWSLTPIRRGRALDEDPERA
jgi:hypothetical protein